MAHQAQAVSIAADARLDKFVSRLYFESAQEAQGLRRLGKSILIDQPADFAIVARNPDVFIKDYSPFEAFGRSRLSENGEEWEIRRRITHSAYVDFPKQRNQELIDATFADRVDRIGDDLSFERLHQAFLESTIILFHRALGFEIDPAGPMRAMIYGRPIIRRMQRIVLFGGTAEEHAQTRSDATALANEISRSIQQHQWLQQILGTFHERSAGIPGFSALEEYLFNMFAGLETSAAAGAWVIDRLGLYPDLQDEIASDIVTAGRSQALEIFVQETMRRFPPIPLVSRLAAHDTDLNGSEIRQGESVLVSIVGLHHNPRCWSDPHVFNPGRPEFLDQTFDRRAYAPFLTGPRVCGGAKLAQVETIAAVKAFLERFRAHRRVAAPDFSLAIALRPTPDPAAIEIRPRFP